jgi:hypothetical protein
LPFSVLKHVEKYKITISKQGKRMYYNIDNWISFFPIINFIPIE